MCTSTQTHRAIQNGTDATTTCVTDCGSTIPVPTILATAVDMNAPATLSTPATNTAVEHQAADYCLLAGNRKLGGGSLPVSIGEHSDVLDTSPEAGGKVDHVTIYTGGFAHALTLIAGSHDSGSITNPPLAGWGPVAPVTPITLQPEEVGQELADQR